MEYKQLFIAFEENMNMEKAIKMSAYMRNKFPYLGIQTPIAIDHQLLRKEKTNATLLETILMNNFGQTEFFINKAIGWSLRDFSKTNPKWVKDFIDKYYDHFTPLSIKDASKYC